MHTGYRRQACTYGTVQYGALALFSLLLLTLQREVSTSFTWDGGSVEPLIHSHLGAMYAYCDDGRELNLIAH